MNDLSGHSGQKASGVRGRPSLKAEQLRCETMCANELRVGEKEGYALGFIPQMDGEEWPTLGFLDPDQA